jgi:hypothetical protein
MIITKDMCNLKIDNYKLFTIEQISSYSYENFISWNCILNKEDVIQNYYFIIDTISDEAFGHWIFESAIYLPVFKELQKIYPNIKLVLKTKKTFKTLFCSFFNIEPIYTLETNNLCIFPTPLSALNDKHITQEWKQYVYNFRSYFQKETEIRYENIVMPRQVKENFAPNDRQYNFGNLIKQLSDAYILNTDEIVDLKDQINIIQSGKNIYLSEGSPFLVNGLFCKNKQIFIAFPTYTYIQQEHQFIKMKFIFDLHREFNKVSYLN